MHNDSVSIKSSKQYIFFCDRQKDLKVFSISQCSITYSANNTKLQISTEKRTTDSNKNKLSGLDAVSATH